MRGLLFYVLTILSFGLITGNVSGQKGSISGMLYDSLSREPVPFANVVIEGTTIGVATDFDGKFDIPNLNSGSYNLVVSAIGFKKMTIRDVKVLPGKKTTLKIGAVSSSIQIQDVEIVAEKITQTETAVMVETKSAVQVVSGISGQQVARSMDRDAAEVVRRLPAVTVVDNRFINVRGLSERYNLVMLNNVLTPSVEPDIKSFAFDLVPSGLLDRLLVYKTPSADLPGEFAGAVVKIYTRNPSDRNEVSFGYNTSYREGTTFQEFVTNKLSPYEVLGFDNGVRNIPEGLPTRIWDTMNVNIRSGYTRKFPNNWQPQRTTAIPDQRFNLNISNAFGKKLRVGHTTSINYSNTNLGVAATRDDFNELPPDSLLGKRRPDTLFTYLDRRYENNVRIGLVHNWSFSTRHHRIEIKNLFNQLGMNQVVLREGKEIVESFQYRNEYSFRYVQRSIYNVQLNAQHDIGANGKLDYSFGFSKAWRNEPDWRRIRYTRPLDDPLAPFMAIVANDANPFFLGRLYFRLREHIITGNANYEHRFKLGSSGKFLTLKTGGFYEYKRRHFNARNLGYKPANIFTFDYNIAREPVDSIFRPENLNSQTGLVISESTNRSDSYRATNRLHAGYVMADIPFWRFRLNTGVRVEYNIQELDSTYSFTLSQPVRVYNPILSILPSSTLIFNVAEKHSLKGAFGITVNRPEFRELAPFSFYDFNLNIVIYGNEGLKTPRIFNYDFKYEFSPSLAEAISVGGFYKKFVDPIEAYFIPGAGSAGTRNFSFQNAESAFSTGAELEFRKTLDFGIKGLRDITLVGNAAYIYSRIELGEKAKGQNNNRPLMGQSPYVVNTGIFYLNEKIGLQANILYNVIGPRIVIVGSQGIPDIYEMPRNIIDLSVSKIFNLSGPNRKIQHQLEARFGLQDLLNQPILMVQDINGNNRVERHDDWTFSSFRRGRYVTVGFNYRIR